MDFELYENALIYSLSCSIFIRNLTTKTVINKAFLTKCFYLQLISFSFTQTKVHKPFGLENKKFINYLLVENGFLCVAAGFRVMISEFKTSILHIDSKKKTFTALSR